MPNGDASLNVSASVNHHDDKSTAFIDEIEITGYRLNIRKRCVTWFFILLTCGILRLILHWRSDWFLHWTHDRSSLLRADSILVRDPYKQYFVVPIEVCTRSGKRIKRSRGPLALVRALLAKRPAAPSSISIKQRPVDGSSLKLAHVDVASKQPPLERFERYDQQHEEVATRLGCAPTIIEEESSVALPSVATSTAGQVTSENVSRLKSAEARLQAALDNANDEIVRVVTIRCDVDANPTAIANASGNVGAEQRDTVCIQLEPARSSSAMRHVDANVPLLSGVAESASAIQRSVARGRRASFRACDSSDDDALNFGSDLEEDRLIRYFVDRNVKYVFDEEAGCFKKVTGLGLDHIGSVVMHYNDDATRKQTEITGSTFHEVYVAGVNIRTRLRRIALYGRNVVDVELTPIAKLLVREILHPFYIFQVLSCVIWYTDQYEWFATAILVTSVVSIAVATFQTRRMQRNLRAMLDEHCAVAVKVASDDQHFDSAAWRRLVGDVETASAGDRVADEPDAEDSTSVGVGRPTPTSTKRRKMNTIGSSQSESDEEPPDDVFVVTAGGRPDGVNESVMSAKSTGFNDSVRSRRSARSGSGRRQRTASARRSVSTLLRTDDVDELDASSSRVRCARGGVFRTIASDLLVPGDVIEIPRGGCVMQCDAVLIAGQCIVNESSLTGESVPVTKTPIACDAPANLFSDARSTTGMTPTHSEMFSVKTHSRHILFGGTRVIQTRYFESQRVLAIVIRTGFMTSKGELIRSILFPKPVDFKFIRQSFQFVLVLSVMAGLGTIYTALVMTLRNGEDIVQTLRYVLNLVTVAIPPSLPAAMTVGIVFAQARLKRNQIYCIAPNSINVSGSIDLVCFDKTGTLTEDGLDVHGLWPIASLDLPCEQPSVPRERERERERLISTRTRHESTRTRHESHSSRLDESSAPNGGFSSSRRSRKRTFTNGHDHDSPSEYDMRLDDEHELLVDERALAGELPAGFGRMVPPEAFKQLPIGSLLLEALATCHSLTKLNGALCGDPLDVKQFEAVGWDLFEPGDEEHRYEMMCPSVVRPRCAPPMTVAASPPLASATTTDVGTNVPARDPDVSPIAGAGGDATDTVNVEISQEACAEKQTANALLETCLTESIRKELGEETWPYEIGILRQHVFVNALQRSSVIVRVLGEKDCRLYVKGAPELIASLCHRESLPPAFHALLSEHTRKGYRVLAFAYRRLPAEQFSYTRLMRLNREALECDLEFLGLLVLENRLKAETRGVIRLLNASRIRSVMVTGDNLLTALSVARDCEMIAADEQIVIVSTNTPTKSSSKGDRSAPPPAATLTDSLDEVACIARFLRFRAESGAALAVSFGEGSVHAEQRDARPIPPGEQLTAPLQPQNLDVDVNMQSCATPEDVPNAMEALVERPSVCSYAERRKTIYWQNRVSFAMTGECWQFLHEAWTLYSAVCDAYREQLRNSRSACRQPTLTMPIPSVPAANTVVNAGNNASSEVSVAGDCLPAVPDRTPPSSGKTHHGNRPTSLFSPELSSDVHESAETDTELPPDQCTGDERQPSNMHARSVTNTAGGGLSATVCAMNADERTFMEATAMLPLLNAVLANTVVCARMLPEQKQQLIERLQVQRNYVAMCGDGANDTGALKAAHTGISLSEAEASVAAPFTSKRPTIECVPTVIREGRCALVTSFGVFKFIACYSLTQFLTVLMLYYMNLNLSDWQYFYIDLAVVMSLSITIGRTRAADTLSRRRPMTDLVNFSTIMSIITQMTIVGVAQGAALWLVTIQPFYFDPHPDSINHEEHYYESFSNTVLFSVSLFQYVVLALVYAKGKPHRAPAYTNIWFLLNVLVLLAISGVVLIYQGPDFVAKAFQLHHIVPIRFKCLLALIVLANLLASYLAEEYLFDNAEMRRACRALVQRYKAKLRTMFSGTVQTFAFTSRRNPVSSTGGGLPVADCLKQAERTYNTVTMNREMDTLYFLEEPVSSALLSFRT